MCDGRSLKQRKAKGTEVATRKEEKLDAQPDKVNEGLNKDDFVFNCREKYGEGKGLLALLKQWLVMMPVIHYYFWFWIALGIFYALYSRGYWYIVVLAVTLYLPGYFNNDPKKGGRRWEWWVTQNFWHQIAIYINLEIIRQEELDPKKLYVFGKHPHGIMILSRISTYGKIWDAVFPGISNRVLAATPIFSWPGAREMCLWVGAVDASKKSAKYVLDTMKTSVLVYPGGIQEMFQTDPDSKETRITLKNRKGFVKLAMESGADLVPTFVFGERDAYKVARPPKAVWDWVYKRWKVPLLYFYGRFMTMIPFRPKNKLGMVYGKPIPVEKNPNPTDEEVAEMHQKYMDAIQDIYDQYKGRYGYGNDEPLVFT